MTSQKGSSRLAGFDLADELEAAPHDHHQAWTRGHRHPTSNAHVCTSSSCQFALFFLHVWVVSGDDPQWRKHAIQGETQTQTSGARPEARCIGHYPEEVMKITRV